MLEERLLSQSSIRLKTHGGQTGMVRVRRERGMNERGNSLINKMKCPLPFSKKLHGLTAKL
jgi:hypothetical protein